MARAGPKRTGGRTAALRSMMPRPVLSGAEGGRPKMRTTVVPWWPPLVAKVPRSSWSTFAPLLPWGGGTRIGSSRLCCGPLCSTTGRGAALTATGSGTWRGGPLGSRCASTSCCGRGAKCVTWPRPWAARPLRIRRALLPWRPDAFGPCAAWKRGGGPSTPTSAVRCGMAWRPRRACSRDRGWPTPTGLRRCSGQR